ncbi:MAG: hypothetical protein IJ466_11485 [Clostridia bacterium]|nr:hypothetical protein [Clostridia bacterium]
MEWKNNLANLLKVKTIVTLVVLLVFAVLALRGDISPDNVLSIVAMVISFYFGTQIEKKEKVEVPVEVKQMIAREE